MAILVNTFVDYRGMPSMEKALINFSLSCFPQKNWQERNPEHFTKTLHR
jgi:hypothetical protein